MRVVVASQQDHPNRFVVDDVENVLQSNDDHDSDQLTDN
jgi:hypothetical protein